MLEFYLVDCHLFQFSVHNSHFEALFTIRAFPAEGPISLFSIFFDTLFAKKHIAFVALVGIYRNIQTHYAAKSF